MEAGEVIALLDTILYDEQRVRIEAELREYEAELEVKKAELEALRTNPLPKELWYAETNLKESEDKAKRTQARLNRSLQLSSSNAISKREFEDAEIENIKVQGELARARENLAKVKSGIGERNIEKAERDIDLVRAKIEGRKEELKLVERRIRECRIVAPNDGRLVSAATRTSGFRAVFSTASSTVRSTARWTASTIRRFRTPPRMRRAIRSRSRSTRRAARSGSVRALNLQS